MSDLIIMEKITLLVLKNCPIVKKEIYGNEDSKQINLGFIDRDATLFKSAIRTFEMITKVNHLSEGKCTTTY